ncbi:hypothetical protein TNCV_4147611 [Trichonephila clavipes]|nr:hypothetical protein TNCV_4147611 [Trichonephila clavipes]
MEIRTGGLDSNSARYKSSNFESVQRRWNKSHYGGKKGSAPSFWTAANNRTKRGRKETLAYKRSLNLGFGGPQKKQMKGPGNKDQEEEQKWSFDQQCEEDNKEDQFEPEEAENISTALTSKSKQGQQVGRPKAEVVNNSIARREKEERERENSRRSYSLEVLVGVVSYRK